MSVQRGHFNESHDGGRLAAEVDIYIMRTFTERLPEREQAELVIRAAAELDPGHCHSCAELNGLGQRGLAALPGSSVTERLAVQVTANEIAEFLDPWLRR